MSTSHKRTSSAAGNTNAGPEVKRQTPISLMQNLSHPESQYEPQYVYVVVIESAPQYTDSTSDIHGIYAMIKDANNALKGVVNDFGDPEECTYGIEDDGRLYWASGDAGEGERIEVRIQVEEVKQPGSEPEREIGPNFGVLEDASEEDVSEDGNSDEDNEE